MTASRSIHSPSGVQRQLAASSNATMRMDASVNSVCLAGVFSSSVTNCRASWSASMGDPGSAIRDSGTSASSSADTRNSKGLRVRSEVRSASMARMIEWCCVNASATSAALASRCSPSSRLRMAAIFLRMRVSPPASIARSHSVSSPMERLLKLEDPMRNSSSSMTSIFACTLIHCSPRPGTCGQ